VNSRLLGGQLGWLFLAFVGASTGALITSTGPLLTGLAAAGAVAVICLLLLTVARYESVVATGFLVLGVLLVEPALPDLIFGVVILVAVLTGRTRTTLRRSPPIVVYAVGVLIALNVVAMGAAVSVVQAVLFVSITTYLFVFALWLAGYIDSRQRARRLVECVTIGAAITGALTLIALFAPFPGSSEFVYFDRAKGLFKDPNVFGPFMIVPFAFVLAELVEPSLLTWRRRWLVPLLLVCGAAALFSYSRAAWLNMSLLVVTMILAYGLRRGGLRRAAKTLALGLAAVSVLAAAVVLTGSTHFFFERAHVQNYDTSRFQGQYASFGLARSHLFGVGPGQYKYVVGLSPQSTYLRALGEQGVLGLAFTVFLLAATLVLACGNVIHGRSTYGISSVPLLGLWIGILANSFFLDTLHWRHLWLVAGLIWGGSTIGQSHGRVRSGQPLAIEAGVPGLSHGRSSQISLQ
jgi:O-antigen ligase